MRLSAPSICLLLPLALALALAAGRLPAEELSGSYRLSLSGALTDTYFHSLKEDRAQGMLELGYHPSEWCRFGVEVSGVFQELETYHRGEEIYLERLEVLAGPQVAFLWPRADAETGRGAPAWFRPFLDFSLGAAWERLEDPDYRRSEDLAFYWRAGLGAHLFPVRWASIDLRVSYGQVVWSPRVGGPEDRLFVAVGVSLWWGGGDG